MVNEETKDDQSMPTTSTQSQNAKLFTCANCKKDLYLTTVDILKHKKSCR